MHDVGEALDGQVLLHLYGAEAADLPNVVPPQVHQHVVFGQLLFVRQEFFFQPLILLRCPSPGPGARQGEGVEHPVLQLYQCLGRRPGQFHVVAGEVEQVGGGIDGAQDAVHVQQ